MFWILRRTRLMSGGNNVPVNSNVNNNNNANKPTRKDYKKFLDIDNNANNKNNGNKDIDLKDNVSESVYIAPPSNMYPESQYDMEPDDSDDDSEDSDYDEALTCNVCDRAFPCLKQLSSHKQKKRHFGCSACDSLFPSLMALQHHKEEFEHWSGEEETESESESESSMIAGDCQRLL